MSLLDKWEQAILVHPNFTKTMSTNTKIAIMCQTMTAVVGTPKATKENPSGWNFFFKITTDSEEQVDVLEVFSKSHKVLRTYIDYDFKNPIVSGSSADDQAINNLLSSMQFKI